MSDLSWAKIKVLVAERANHTCEYCHTSEDNNGQAMHIDHIDPDSGHALDNLCLACWNCNTSKLDVVVALDPDTGQQVPLFNPRLQVWSEHFEWIEGYTEVAGLTAIGRATVVRLKMNRRRIVTARKRWVESGFHPPSLLA